MGKERELDCIRHAGLRMKNSPNIPISPKSVNSFGTHEDDSTQEFRGCLVTMDCGNYGYFQGRVKRVDGIAKTIEIEQPLKDGIPLDESSIVILSDKINDVKIIHIPPSSAFQFDFKNQQVASAASIKTEESTTNKDNEKSAKLTSTKSKKKAIGNETEDQKQLNLKSGTPKEKKKEDSLMPKFDKSVVPNKIQDLKPKIMIAPTSVLVKYAKVSARLLKNEEEKKLAEKTNLSTVGGTRITINQLMNTEIKVSASADVISSRPSLLPKVDRLSSVNAERDTAQELKCNQSTDYTQEFYGCLVTVDCGSFGYFQGKVKQVDGITKTIEIEQPIKDGIPLDESSIVISSDKINDVKIIHIPSSSAFQFDHGVKNQQVASAASIKMEESTTNKNTEESAELTSTKLKKKTIGNETEDRQQLNLKSRTSKEKKQNNPPIPKFVKPVIDSKPKTMIAPTSVLVKHAKVSTRLIKNVKEKKLTEKTNLSTVEGTRITINQLMNTEIKVSASADVLPSRPCSTLLPTFAKMSSISAESGVAQELKCNQYGDFKHFVEQQVPAPPRRFDGVGGDGNKRHYNMRNGPSGMPLLDASNGYSKYSFSKLSAPLDFKLLDTDFDFDTNLALFDKNDVSLDVEEKSNACNFRNDENVLGNDPDRVTSWVNKNTKKK